MLDELFQFNLGHCHQTLNLIFRPVEVLDAEGVDGNNLNAGLITDFEYLTLLISNIFFPYKPTRAENIPLRALRSLDDDPL